MLFLVFLSAPINPSKRHGSPVMCFWSPFFGGLPFRRLSPDLVRRTLTGQKADLKKNCLESGQFLDSS